jgi:hypothetical protein
MEIKINLNENEIRSLVRQELKFYLIQEGMFDSTLKKVFSSFIIAALAQPNLQPEQVIAQEQEQISDNQIMDDFDQMITQQQAKLQADGLSEDTSMKIIAGVLSGVRKQKEQEFKSQQIPQEQQEAEIIEAQRQNIKKLDDIKLVTQIVTSQFLRDVENEGRAAMTTANQQSGAMGTPTKESSVGIGIGLEIQKTLIDTDQDITIKKEKSLGLDPLQLTYWDDVVQKNSNIEKHLKDTFETIYIRKSDYTWAAENSMQNYIASQMKENKIKKLKERINELRGNYV